jgi:Xaa-Pro aminopeptidase
MNADVPVFPPQEYDRRLDRVRALMAQRGLDGLLISSPENIYYLPRATMDRLHQRYVFHVWTEHSERPIVRWMTAFDTEESEVDDFLAFLTDTAAE